jgi:hypothetical protein
MFKCSNFYLDLEKLLAHEGRIHVKVPRNPRENTLRNRAAKFTTAITRDLQQLASINSPAPILLSLGFDGYTCNTTLLLSWLHDIDINFALAICTKPIISGINDKYFPKVDNLYFGLYDSRTLQAYREDRSRASTECIELFDHWDGLQQAKDCQLEHVKRNKMTESNGQS